MNKIKKNGFAPILIILAIAILGVIGYFAYRNYNPKPQTLIVSSPNSSTTSGSNVVWKTYKTNTSYGNISFEYPDTYPVTLIDDSTNYSKLPIQGIQIRKFDINKDNSDAPELNDKEFMQNYYNQLVMGKTTKEMPPFSMWALKESDQIVKSKTGKFARVSTTFGSYEVCDLQFSFRADIAVNNSIISISIDGDPAKIEKSMGNSGLFKQWDGCESKSFADGGMQDFYKIAISGGGTPEARVWFDTANHVVSSLNF